MAKAPPSNKLPLASLSITDDKLARLRELLPEAFTESKVDFEKLKQSLGEQIETGRERYGLNWAGKSEAIRTLQAPGTGTLRPCPEESVNFDASENLIIEGDNLEVLKLLQKSYYGKVKMIYIDPPYNTGNDFIYADDFSDSLKNYLRYSGQIDDEGNATTSDQNCSGRFHSNWLNMMYPRLYLARNLLRDDGVIFVSIDDNEIHNLRLLMNEVFGEENFVDCLIWKKRYGGGAKEKYLVSVHEYILMYAKSKIEIEDITVSTSQESIERYYKDKDENFSLRGPYRTHPLEATKSMGERKNLVFEIIAPDGSKIFPKRQWLWSKERVELSLKKGELAFLKDKDGEWSVHTKQYLKNENGEIRSSKAFSLIDDVYTQHGTNEVIDIFGDAHTFSFPKPSRLIRKLIEIGSGLNSEDIILDFFGGSGTTAQAVMELNEADGGNRKFILVQLPEKTDKPEYPTIAHITRERIRRVISKIEEARSQSSTQGNLLDSGETKEKQILGFRALRLASSNFKLWDSAQAGNNAEQLAAQLELHANNVDMERSEQDVLFELILRSGLPLNANIEKVILGKQQGYRVQGDDRNLLICLAQPIEQQTLDAMREQKADTLICLDIAFAGDDALKTNTVLQMKDAKLRFYTV